MAEPEKVIPSTCGEYQARIEQRSGGGLQVTVFRWTEERVPGYGKIGEFWERVSRPVMIADTVERVDELAEEEFRSLGTTARIVTEEA
jgi:hypothetical protein